MSSVLTIIVYSIAIVAFYALILWFIHKAGGYFKKLDEKIGNTFNEACNDSIFYKEKALTPEETIEQLKTDQHVSPQIETADNIEANQRN